jgi:Zn-dependent peptidase ImmA (M78 family)
MNTISIKPELLAWARKRAGLEISDLVKPFPKFNEWEQGSSSPTLRQLEAIAAKLWAPLGYFFLQAPPEEKLPIPDFRSVGDAPIIQPSPDLLETVFSMQRRQIWYREFIQDEGAGPLPFVGSAKLGDSPIEVAAKMRATLGVSANWARSMKTWEDAFRALWLNAEHVGIIVVCNGVVGNNATRILDVDEFRGFVLSDAYAPFVFINNADAKAAQMFTLVHELVHIWLDAAGVLNFREMIPSDNETELFCNAVAAEFLVPQDEIAILWKNQKSYQGLANHFKVSSLVVARRLLDLKFIKKDEFFKFYNSIMAEVRAKKEAKENGGTFYANCNYRIGQPFAEAINRAVKGHKLLYNDAYKLTGIRGPTFDKYIFKANLGDG